MQCTIFGTGPLGLWVAKQLVEQGKHVVLVNRSGRIPPYMPPGLLEQNTLHKNVKIRAGNAQNSTEVYQLSNESDVVFLCAMPPYTDWTQNFEALTKGILDGVASTEAKLIYGDNLYAYGDTSGEIITEESPLHYQGYDSVNGKIGKGHARALMAESLLKAHQKRLVRVAIGRASDFYGPGVTNSALGELFFKAALKGKSVNLLGDTGQPHTLTYIKDFANALVTLSEHEEALGQIWHVPSAPTLSMEAFSALVSAELNRPVKMRSSGRFTISLLGVFSPMIRELKEMMYAWEHPYVVSHEKYENAFGTNTTPHVQAIKETLDWYRSLGP